MTRYILGLLCLALFVFSVLQSERANKMQCELWLATDRADRAAVLALSASAGWVETAVALERCEKKARKVVW